MILSSLIHLASTLFVQLLLMTKIEQFLGWFRLTIIYFGAGIGGYLLSSYMVPYKPDVGPSGAHFGLLAYLFAELWTNWYYLAQPWRLLVKYLVVVFVLFALGFLPWVDNFAHIGGFVCGGLLSLAFSPYFMFDPHSIEEKRAKKRQITISLLLFLLIFVSFMVLFYMWPAYPSETWRYLSCIGGSDFCQDFNTKIQRQDIL